MLTAKQKAEAERKLKNMQEELAYEEQLKTSLKQVTAAVRQAIASLDNDPPKQMALLSQLANNILPQKIIEFDSAHQLAQDVQDKLKTEKQKMNRESLNLIEEKQRYQGGIEQIKATIKNIQKTVKESVKQEVAKRQKIEDDLEKSLGEIRSKIEEFQKESADFDKENEELRVKIEELKGKIGGIEDKFKAQAQEKDEQVKSEKEQLTGKLKELEIEVEQATALNKEFGAVQKKNFDNKLSLYLRTKKFPEYSSSFETSAKTLNSCKEELLKGVARMNAASDSLEASEKLANQNSNLFLMELKNQKEKQEKIDAIKKEKEVVRGRIIELQAKLKAKKESA